MGVQRIVIPFGIGVAGVAVGVLPWVLLGDRTTLLEQAVAADPAHPPFALVPLTSYAVLTLLGSVGLGHVIAALAVYALRRRAVPAWPAFVGVLLADGIATAQSAAAIAPGLGAGSASSTYLAALLAVVAVSVVVGAVAFWLIARAPAPGRMIGLALGAVLLGHAALAVSTPFGRVYGLAYSAYLQAVDIGIPVLAGLAIAVVGIRTTPTRVAAVVVLALLWLHAVVSPSIEMVAGTRVYWRFPSEMLAYGLGILGLQLTAWDRTLTPVVIAVASAGVGLAVREVLRRRAATSATTA